MTNEPSDDRGGRGRWLWAGATAMTVGLVARARRWRRPVEPQGWRARLGARAAGVKAGMKRRTRGRRWWRR